MQLERLGRRLICTSPENNTMCTIITCSMVRFMGAEWQIPTYMATTDDFVEVASSWMS